MKAVKLRVSEVSGLNWAFFSRSTNAAGPRRIGPVDQAAQARVWTLANDEESLNAFASERRDEDTVRLSVTRGESPQSPPPRQPSGTTTRWPWLVLAAATIVQAAYLGVHVVGKMRQDSVERLVLDPLPTRLLANPMALTLPATTLSDVGRRREGAAATPAEGRGLGLGAGSAASPRAPDARRQEDQPAEPAESAAAAPGWAAIELPIQVNVFEHGRFVGTNDTGRLLLSAGLHELELVNESLQYQTKQTIYVSSGKVVPIAVDLPSGSVSLNALPWSDVTIDGQPVGATPLGRVRLSLGPHQIVFRHPQLGERTRTIVVTAGAETRLTVDLRK